MRRAGRTYVDRERVVVGAGAEVDAADVLAGLPREPGAAPVQVYLAGPMPDAGQVHAFGVPPDGWAVNGGHYVSGSSPIWRFRHDATRTRVDVHHASSWFGPDAADAGAVARAFDWMDAQLPALVEPGVRVLATPSVTARDLMLRCCPRGHVYAPMHQDFQRLVRGPVDGVAPAPQARTERTAQPWDGPPAVWIYDARFAYAALCRELPVGDPEVYEDEDASAVLTPYAAARVVLDYRVTDGAPVGPFHVWDTSAGAAGTRGAWTWPTDPNVWHRSEVDNVELAAAVRAGLVADVRPRRVLLWPVRARPLTTWADKLVRAREAAPDALTRAALRNVLLQGIGALQGRPHKVSRAVPLAQAAEVPAGVQWRREGGWLRWDDYADPPWTAMVHPEWSTTVWARARARLLTNPQGVLTDGGGAVLGFRTDAIYTTRPLPWFDDGRPGRFRLLAGGPLPADTTLPTGPGGLLRLKAAALRQGFTHNRPDDTDAVADDPDE